MLILSLELFERIVNIFRNFHFIFCRIVRIYTMDTKLVQYLAKCSYYTPTFLQISARQHLSQCGFVLAVQTSRP